MVNVNATFNKVRGETMIGDLMEATFVADQGTTVRYESASFGASQGRRCSVFILATDITFQAKSSATSLVSVRFCQPTDAIAGFSL